MHEYIVYYTYKPLYGIRDLLLYRWVDPKKLILSNGEGSVALSGVGKTGRRVEQ